MQPSWEQSKWLDREQGFKSFLPLLLWPMELNQYMKVQEAKRETGKGSNQSLQLILTSPVQK